MSKSNLDFTNNNDALYTKVKAGVKMGMTTNEAIEWIKKVTWRKYTDHSPEIFSQYKDGKAFSKDKEDIIALLKSKQELVTKFSGECDEYQKNLDKIDLWTMEIENLIKKIRGKI